MTEIYQEPNITSTLPISQAFNLTDADISRRPFVSERALRLAGVRRVNDDVGHQILCKTNPQKDVEFQGLGIPYLFDDGKSQQITEWTIRRDVPDYEKNGTGELKEKRKYMKPPGAKNQIYIPPMLPAELLKDANSVLVITEGEFKTLALAEAATNDFTSEDWAFVPVGLSGVYNFKTRRKGETPQGTRQISEPVADFDLLALDGRRVGICFDSDLSDKSAVRTARSQLIRFLKEKGAKVFNINFPQTYGETATKGVDDFLQMLEQMHGRERAVDSFLKLVENAQKPKSKPSPMADNFELVENDPERAAGVYYSDTQTGENSRVCSPLKVIAETQTEKGESYGRFLKWSDSKGRIKTWAMPLELVHSDGYELVKYLVSRGLIIGTRRLDHDRLKNYINLSQPDETIICTAKLGWNNDVFVFPDETIGAESDPIVYQPEYMPAHKFGAKGTLEEWQTNISKYCAGNSHLAFGVSLAFAAPLLPIVEVQSGGFHNRGGTSSGKTTVSFVAGSVVGGSDDELGYCQSWKATANGLESVAETHNHALLCLDELAQIDGRQAADVGYMLANGTGKIRQNKSITGRRSLSWQLLFLSTGEISLADKMNEAGLTIKGGQEIRVLDIPADTGKFGVFDTLHEFPNGQTFADHLRSASHNYYGTAIREYLRGLVALERPEIKNGWRDFLKNFTEQILPKNKKHPSEVYRAAARFALVAFAGETATKLGITQWKQGEAVMAAEAVFQVWFDNRNGRGTSDAERAISQIRAFIEAHGASRFEMLNASDDSLDTGKIINRAGFRKQNALGELEFLFLPEVFRSEVCKGFDYKFVCRILDERNLLQSDSVGFQKQLKYGGVHLRPYWVSSKIMGEPEDNEMSATAGAIK